MSHDLKEPPSPAETLNAELRGEPGPFVVATEKTRMPMIFTDATQPDNPLIFANDSFLELTGFSREEAIGRPIGEIIRSATGSRTRSSIMMALDAGAEGEWELHCWGAGQTEFLAAIFLSPVFDHNGNLAQNFLSFVPIGSHLDRLIQERNELYAIYEQAPGFIAIMHGPDHRITFANAAHKRFVDRDELEGLTVAEALPEIASQGFLETLDRVFATGEPFVGRDMPVGIPKRDTGKIEQRYADFIYQPIRAADDTITGLFCEGYDVTAKHEAADRLAALQADMIHVSRANAMGTMAITLAHELNQPLSAIVNYAEGGMRLIDPAGSKGESLSEALSAISEAALRAGEIIRNLRDLTTRQISVKSSFELCPAVGECIRLVEAVAQPSVVISDRTPRRLEIRGDRIQVQQVLINLLRNACEALDGRDRQEVSISATEAGNMVVVSVIDTGPGISSTAAQSLFSFVESIKEGGMGIGLSISRTIIDAHGGRIWLENSDETGTEIRFSLPLGTDDSPDSSRPN